MDGSADGISDDDACNKSDGENEGNTDNSSDDGSTEGAVEYAVEVGNNERGDGNCDCDVGVEVGAIGSDVLRRVGLSIGEPETGEEDERSEGVGEEPLCGAEEGNSDGSAIEGDSEGETEENGSVVGKYEDIEGSADGVLCGCEGAKEGKVDGLFEGESVTGQEEGSKVGSNETKEGIVD